MTNEKLPKKREENYARFFSIGNLHCDLFLHSFHVQQKSPTRYALFISLLLAIGYEFMFCHRFIVCWCMRVSFKFTLSSVHILCFCHREYLLCVLLSVFLSVALYASECVCVWACSSLLRLHMLSRALMCQTKRCTNTRMHDIHYTVQCILRQKTFSGCTCNESTKKMLNRLFEAFSIPVHFFLPTIICTVYVFTFAMRGFDHHYYFKTHSCFHKKIKSLSFRILFATR